MLMRIASVLAEAPIVPGVEALLQPPAPQRTNHARRSLDEVFAPESVSAAQVGD
jgi:hypothetical protein